ncbi:hypothetical protein G9464_10725 [Halostella sp. JP-L12]|uniref:hypothetical protein n=1 Tax=Halostella TaxID=1843185 RepID=UPI000EF77FC4|nr:MULTISPECIES: hypothetical protein [Halostella]NHN48070.1 hypothetical protein [Halostella sp. JP-L12]
MTQDIDKQTVRNWIDDDLVQRIEDVTDGDEAYNYLVQVSGMNFHIGRVRGTGPISVASTIEFDPETVALLMEREEKRRDLLTRFERVLTIAPGWYTFLDGAGNPGCNFTEMRSIRLEYRIYPDGASQHALMNGLIDMANALVFLRDVMTSLAEAADE